MTVSTVRRDDVEIAYETFGPASGEPLLLVMGTGGQLLAWHPDFCRALVDRGFQMTRFDNRDSGLSTRFSGSGTPGQLKMWLRPAAAAVYRLEDMADDAVAVLDAQDRPSAHVVGVIAGRDDRPDHGDQASGPGTDTDLPRSRARRTIPSIRRGFASSVSSAMSAGTTSARYNVRPRSSSPPATAAHSCPPYASRPWSSTAKRTRWSVRSPARKPRPPSPAPPSSPFPEWATTYLAHCGRPSSTTFTT